MALLSTVKDVFSDPAAYLPVVQEKGQHVLDLVKSNPWASLGVATGTALLWSYGRAPRNLPPGPTNYPFIGATSILSELGDVQKMLGWRPKYGEILSFYMLGQLYVVLNSDRTIREAFVKRQEEFSHRAEEFYFKVSGLKDDIFMAPYNETWKKNKKFALTTLKTYGFGTPKSEEKIHNQLEILEEFILKANASPLDIENEMRTMCSALISTIVFGGDASWDSPNITELVQLTTEWTMDLSACAMLPLKDINPWLAIKLGRKTVQKYNASNEALLAYLQRRIKEHVTGLSDRESSDVVDAYLRERGTDEETVKCMSHTILAFLPDAIHTSSLVDNWLLFFMTLYPEVQKKLKEEVISICGQNRSPTFADRPKMHYVQAFIHESLRNINVVSMSAAREVKENLTLDGYNFPKGTYVMANFSGVHYDTEVFPNPEKFDPSRFLQQDGTFDASMATKVLAFSLGSRQCIAQPFFKVTAFLFITRLLQRFDLEFDPSVPKPSAERDTTSFYIAKPDSFKVCFKPS